MSSWRTVEDGYDWEFNVGLSGILVRVRNDEWTPSKPPKFRANIRLDDSTASTFLMRGIESEVEAKLLAMEHFRGRLLDMAGDLDRAIRELKVEEELKR